MPKIVMQTEQMRSNADELAALRQHHLDLMRKLRILIHNLSDIWQGEAQEAFVNSFQRKSQDINNLATTLDEYISVVRAAADKIEQVDNDLLSKANKL